VSGLQEKILGQRAQKQDKKRRHKLTEIIKPDFNYSLIQGSDSDVEFLKGKEQAIKSRTAQTVIENGRDLLEAKQRVGHGIRGSRH
jgi:hypothetical protein